LKVFLTGSFVNWKEQIPMLREGNEFYLDYPLEQGEHSYKFIVDGEWRYASNQPSKLDNGGNINNEIKIQVNLEV
jgi:5'-AMP-activated protein kinase regulatory beta subunit